ncbi:MAG: peptidoglycan DD-metalloendopeptidase family protein [Bacteroidetes bacterium]|nr:peptidoglycan DD-metalloendopeptidase family protein [Bacteroidota bacterium]
MKLLFIFKKNRKFILKIIVVGGGVAYLAIFVRTPKKSFSFMRILYVLLFCLFAKSVVAQQSASRSDLEKRRESIMQAIRETQEQLEMTKKDKNVSLAQLRALQNKLAARQRLIGNINEEISEINKNILSSSHEISGLRLNLDMLKVRYAQSVRYAYKNRASYNMIAFLFSATDFNEAIRRLKYLKKYRDYRKEQAEQIRTTQTKIEKKIGELNTVKSQKDVLRAAEEQQKIAVQQEANETDKVVRELKGREKELAHNIDQNRKAARNVDQAIHRIIQKEIELARRKAEEEQRKKREEQARSMNNYSATNPSNATTGTSSKITVEKTNPATNTITTRPREPRVASNTSSYISNLTPEVAALSAGFEHNRGRLPWPVEKGFISQGFGKYQHPVETKVYLENNGIDISTNPGTAVRAVFPGVVTSVFFAGLGSVVVINHGEFFTVYNGLSSVSVKKDQSVSGKQTIGVVGTNNEGANVVNFQIWKITKGNQSVKLDPAQWIAR